MITGKIGVLLVNLGTPDEPTRGAVYRYLKEFLLDPRVIDINPIARNLLVRGIIAPFRSGQSAKGYQKLWTKEGSPLKVHGFAVRDAVQKILGDDFVVELAMRYQNPSIASVITKMMKQPIREWIVLPMFPQYASASTGSAHEEVMRVFAKEQVIPTIKFINSFYDHPAFINAFLARAAEYDLNEYDHILFSYHGLPQRQMRKADKCNHCFVAANCCSTISAKNQYCYSAQCHATTKALVEKLGIKADKYTICYQSRLGRDPWIPPYTSDILKVRAAAGDKKILVFCPAFVSDCLETTVEISDEYAEEFEHLGGEKLQLVEGLNSHPTWIKGIAEIVLEQCTNVKANSIL
jgi:ferrochelatase